MEEFIRKSLNPHIECDEEEDVDMQVTPTFSLESLPSLAQEFSTCHTRLKSEEYIDAKHECVEDQRRVVHE